jgi:hypothetical protein
MAPVFDLFKGWHVENEFQNAIHIDRQNRQWFAMALV